MKKFMFGVLFLMFSAVLFAADFNITLISITQDKAVIAIPRNVGGSPTFAVSMDWGNTITTSSRNAKIDTNTVTVTVRFDQMNKIHYINASEVGATYISSTLTITAKPALQEVISDRDALVYDNRVYFESARENVNVTEHILDVTPTDYELFLTEIVVTGDDIGEVAVYVDAVVVRRYSYNANNTSGQILSTKIPVPKGSTLSVVLESGNTGNHCASISAEIVR